MNIFILDLDPEKAAQYHCDKHVVKMILESAQLLSTAHRVLDGAYYTRLSASGRKLAGYELEEPFESLFYKATHINHPCAIWCRETSSNYIWLENLFVELCKSYTNRYGRIHLCEVKFADVFAYPPKNIKSGDLTPFALAMSDEYKSNDPVESYRQYYINEKSDFAVWKYSETPFWYKT